MKDSVALKYIFIYVGIAIGIALVWQLYEKVVYGEIRPDLLDTLICVALSLSLTVNLFFIREMKKR